MRRAEEGRRTLTAHVKERALPVHCASPHLPDKVRCRSSSTFSIIGGSMPLLYLRTCLLTCAKATFQPRARRLPILQRLTRKMSIFSRGRRLKILPTSPAKGEFRSARHPLFCHRVGAFPGIENQCSAGL